MHKSVFNLNRIFKAYGYSLKGLAATWQQEAAFRQEIVFFVLLSPLAWWLGETHVDYILLFGVLFLVLIVELLNSSLESAINRIGTEQHELSGQAKDQASAAVLLSLILAVVVYGIYAIRKFF